MRRFSLLLFALAIFFVVVTGRKDDAERGAADQPASANAKGQEPGETPRTATAEPSGAGQAVAPQPSPTESELLKNTAILEKRPGTDKQAEPSGFITSAPAHVPASAKSGGIDPSLEGLTGGDLNSALQSELKRLGCYEAKIDGKWGRKSEAAVEAFSERAGRAWSDTSRRELVVALRNYPASFCTTECAEKTPGGQCVVAAAAPKGNEVSQAGKDTSYLPPWMQDAKLTNVEPSQAAPGEQKPLSDVAPITSKPKQGRNVRRRGGDGDRIGQRYERRPVSSRLKNWPGAD